MSNPQGVLEGARTARVGFERVSGANAQTNVG
jgi:hypothetical protein